MQIWVQAPAEFVQFGFSLVSRQGMPVADKIIWKVFWKGQFAAIAWLCEWKHCVNCSYSAASLWEGRLIKLETAQSHSVLLSSQEKEEERSLLLWDEFYILQRGEGELGELSHTRAANFAASLIFTCIILALSNPNFWQHPGCCTGITGERRLFAKNWELDYMGSKE